MPSKIQFSKLFFFSLLFSFRLCFFKKLGIGLITSTGALRHNCNPTHELKQANGQREAEIEISRGIKKNKIKR